MSRCINRKSVIFRLCRRRIVRSNFRLLTGFSSFLSTPVNRGNEARVYGQKSSHCISQLSLGNPDRPLTLGSCAWITDHHNLLITGPTGIGKSFLACAFVERACRRGFTATYLRMPRLLHQLAVGRGDGSFTRLLARLAKLDLLAIDDWLLAPLRDAERRDLTEVIEDRAERGSTLIASQLPATDWHAGIGDPNQADAICDRLLHDAHRLELTGPSMRRTKAAPKTTARPEA